MSVISVAQRLTRRSALHTLHTSVVAGALLGIAPARVLAEDDLTAPVVGSWLIRSGPANKPLAITSLITYTPQGTCIQTTTSHPMRSPAMGVWTQVGEREFGVTFDAFVFDPNGRFTNVSQVRVQSVLDEGFDSYKGRFETYNLDDSGAPVGLTNSGLVAATRIQLARLEAQG